MDLAFAYRQIEERLEKIDFPALFRGFSRFPFALYDDARAFINGGYIEKPAGFLGNTSVQYNGAPTAIWKLEGDAGGFDVLTSKLVHEMLHAFQNAMGEARWADERAALLKYRYDAVNLSTRLEEAACMEKCLRENAPEAFSRLLTLRKARMERFPYAFDYEARIEQIEGTAHFVELNALKQLDPAKAEQRWEQLFAGLKDPARYFPVRSVTYLSGAAFLVCLRKYTEFDTDAFTDTPFAVAALEGVQAGKLPEADVQVEACLADWRSQSRAIVTRTIEKGEIVLDGAYRLIAWNVYDAYWDGTYAVLSAFIGYIEGTTLPDTHEELFARMQIINGDFVAALDENLCLTRVWRKEAA